MAILDTNKLREILIAKLVTINGYADSRGLFQNSLGGFGNLNPPNFRVLVSSPAKGGTMFAPVDGMNKTESNLEKSNKVLVTIGSREVEGMRSMGTGFLINGTVGFIYEGVPDTYDIIIVRPGYAKTVVRIGRE